ncbi:MAG: LPS assembly lipoprotein LptE [Pseudomonadota bacterium]
MAIGTRAASGAEPRRNVPWITAALLLVVITAGGCGYRFGASGGRSILPSDVKTIEIKSVVNSTTITGIETELTNDLRAAFALESEPRLVRSGGDGVLATTITAYLDGPTTFKADGKELTRTGTLRAVCSLNRPGNPKAIWGRDFSSSYTYLVTESIAGTLTNRRDAMSRMVKDLVVRIHRALYEDF